MGSLVINSGGLGAVAPISCTSPAIATQTILGAGVDLNDPKNWQCLVPSAVTQQSHNTMAAVAAAGAVGALVALPGWGKLLALPLAWFAFVESIAGSGGF